MSSNFLSKQHLDGCLVNRLHELLLSVLLKLRVVRIGHSEPFCDRSRFLMHWQINIGLRQIGKHRFTFSLVERFYRLWKCLCIGPFLVEGGIAKLLGAPNYACVAGFCIGR